MPRVSYTKYSGIYSGPYCSDSASSVHLLPVHLKHIAGRGAVLIRVLLYCSQSAEVIR